MIQIIDLGNINQEQWLILKITLIENQRLKHAIHLQINILTMSISYIKQEDPNCSKKSISQE